jgi:hypothetical protein
LTVGKSFAETAGLAGEQGYGECTTKLKQSQKFLGRADALLTLSNPLAPVVLN